MNKKFIIAVVSIFALIILGIILLGKNDDIQKINGEEVRTFLSKHSDAAFIDVRTQSEHAENGINGSFVLPFDQMNSLIENVVPEKYGHYRIL